MSIADYETWWMRSGNFNMNLFINYLRAKNEKLQSDIQSQGWPMDKDGQDHRSQQPRGCHQKDGHVASINFKS